MKRGVRVGFRLISQKTVNFPLFSDLGTFFHHNHLYCRQNLSITVIDLSLSQNEYVRRVHKTIVVDADVLEKLKELRDEWGYSSLNSLIKTLIDDFEKLVKMHKAIREGKLKFTYHGREDVGDLF